MRANDLAIPMRDWSDELLAGNLLCLGRERYAYLSAPTRMHPLAIWQWELLSRFPT